MAERQITFSSAGGAASMDIIIGQAQQGSYRVYHWDSNGRNPQMIGAGTNWDNIADTVEIGPITGLNGEIVTWEMMISAAKVQPGQFYSVNVIFRQDGKIIDHVSDSGPLEGSKSVAGAVRIITT